MTQDEFWRVVEQVHAASPESMAKKCEHLEAHLSTLTATEVESFNSHFTTCYHQAYSYDLWGAAHIIKNGCGDDKFSDFRCTLIAQGHKQFEQALADADSLAGWDISKEEAFWEGYQYVPGKVYERLTGKELESQGKHPKKPAGKAFKEWKMTERYPQLVAKHGYTDKDWEYLKPKSDPWYKKFEFHPATGKQTKGSLTDLMLASGIVTQGGWIPPLKVTAEVLRGGKAPSRSGVKCEWNGFELFEGDYWRAVVELERMEAAAIARTPHIQTNRLQHDVRFNRSADYEDWLKSLEERGVQQGH